MSRDARKSYYRDEYRNYEKHRSTKRSPHREVKHRSRSPRKADKDLDESILREISKLPEPSEMWESQFNDNSYPTAPPAPSFRQETGKRKPVYRKQSKKILIKCARQIKLQRLPDLSNGTIRRPQQVYRGVYDDFSTMESMPPAPQPPEIAWNQLSLPPPPTSSSFSTANVEDQIKKEAAIESEMRHQKATLSKQREDYMKKSTILKKELETLKDQRNELRGDQKRSPSPETKRFLKENTKLQLEIQNKLKTINNVVDMLNGIIGEEAQDQHDSDGSPERSSRKRTRSPSAKKCNYVYYDPEMHWCRICNEFPATAKDYLNHLHSPSHQKLAAAHMEAPWHSISGLNEGFPNYPSGPTKRTPIRGLQFFVPSTAWYCKLCDQFIGDLHCASAHLKSVTHSKNYSNFVEQNPHWETDWMSDRQKSFEKMRTAKIKMEEKPQYTSHTITFNKDGFHTKKKQSPSPAEEKKDKKKKKEKRTKKHKKSSSSSSNTESSSSDSDSPKKRKTKMKKVKHKNEPRSTALNKWMSALQNDELSEKDKKMLDNLKNRIKSDQMKHEEERRGTNERSSVRERERERERLLMEQQRKNRENERRDERQRIDERAKEKHSERKESPSDGDKGDKKAEPRKMPFIGKMPVYKSLGKTTKPEEIKKEDNKKKEDDEVAKKRREEMDAEIQKKVAEFKEKIARAQQERESIARLELAPPGIVIPTELGGSAPPPQLHALPQLHVRPPMQQPPAPASAPASLRPQAPPSQQPPANLPKDFQDALDIIFPADGVKKENTPQEQQGAGYPPVVGGFVPQMGGMGVPQYPPMNMMPAMNPQMMMGFDMNNQMFPPRPQLYDSHVPLAPRAPAPTSTAAAATSASTSISAPRPQHLSNDNMSAAIASAPLSKSSAGNKNENGDIAKKQAELDDLALLGIDASDVGAGM